MKGSLLVFLQNLPKPLLILLVILSVSDPASASGVKSPKPPSEFTLWRGKAGLDDKDMVEIGSWVSQLRNTTNLEDAMKFYWVGNEIYYPFGALIRGMYATFNTTYKEKNFPPSFMLGMEVIVHYILLKSFPLMGRKGGIRGQGTDQDILKAAMPLLVSCFSKAATGQNFTADVFPFRRRKRHARLPHIKRGGPGASGSGRYRGNMIGAGKRKPTHIQRQAKPTQIKTKTKSAQINTIPTHVANMSAENVTKPVSKAKRSADTQMAEMGEAEEGEGQEVEEDEAHSLQRRFTYTLNHGAGSGNQKKTIIDIADKDSRLENIAVSILWLIYEIMPTACSWSQADKETFSKAFEGVVGLVLSMYLFDTDDYAEEYERIFKIPTKAYELEWQRIEAIAKKVQRENSLNIRRPYSQDI